LGARGGRAALTGHSGGLAAAGQQQNGGPSAERRASGGVLLSRIFSSSCGRPKKIHKTAKILSRLSCFWLKKATQGNPFLPTLRFNYDGLKKVNS